MNELMLGSWKDDPLSVLFFRKFDAEVNTYIYNENSFLSSFSKNGKKLCLQRDMRMPKRKDKRKKLISNTVQNALDK